MTLIEQFPDVSMLIREKNRLNLKYKAARLFKGIQYNPITLDQRFYDKALRKWHYKRVVYMGLFFTAMFYLLLNGRNLLNWLAT